MRAPHRILNMVLLLVLLLGLADFPARAEEAIETRIPVACTGAPCTVALFDESGERELARQTLIPGQTAFLVVPCSGLGSYNFILKLVDSGTGAVDLDQTVYRVTVTSYRGEDAAIGYVITAKTEKNPELVLGEEDGKPDRLVFENSPGHEVIGRVCMVSDLRVHKTVDGKPSEACSFVFVLRPTDPSYPMPEGSKDGVAYLSVVGPGEGTFAPITFSAPGVYEYRVSEVSDSAKPYRYDSAIYSIRFAVTEHNGVLQQTRTLFKNGVALTEAEGKAELLFRNVYVGSSTPNTGDDSGLAMWQNLTLISLLGLVLAALLLLADRRREKRQGQ